MKENKVQFLKISIVKLCSFILRLNKVTPHLMLSCLLNSEVAFTIKMTQKADINFATAKIGAYIL